MPTYASSKIPPPKSWDEFEDIVTDVAKLKWKNPNITRYGRNGQRQNGVDISGEPTHIQNEFAGIQCKNWEASLNIRLIEQAVKEAELFDPPIKEFVLACIDKRDASLQTEVMKLSQTRKREGKFSVIIWFWDDLALELAGSSIFMEKHYPQFLKSSMTYDKIIDMINESDVIDWEYNDEDGIFTYKKDVNLVITRFNPDYETNFSEPWLNNFPDKNGYMLIYHIVYNGSLIKKEYIVGVDGFRGYISVPKGGYTENPQITKWEYKMGKIIHSKASGIIPYYSYNKLLELAKISVLDD